MSCPASSTDEHVPFEFGLPSDILPCPLHSPFPHHHFNHQHQHQHHRHRPRYHQSLSCHHDGTIGSDLVHHTNILFTSALFTFNNSSANVQDLSVSGVGAPAHIIPSFSPLYKLLINTHPHTVSPHAVQRQQPCCSREELRQMIWELRTTGFSSKRSLLDCR